MEMLAIVLTLVAVLAMAAEALYRKHLLVQGFTERELLVGKCGVAALWCALWLVLAGEWWNSLAPEKTDARMWWIALIATTLANIVIQFANMRATRLAEVSFVVPISALTPGLVVLSGFLIGEIPSTIGLVGIGLIVAGTYAHAREGATLREYFTPLFFWLAFRDTETLSEKERNRFRALRWAYAGALCATVGLMGDGLVARHGDMILAVAIELVVLALVYAAFLPRTHGVAVGLRRWGQSALLGCLAAVPFLALGLAFRLAPISYIGSLKRLAIVLTVLGGIWLLKESSGARRMFLALVIVSGAMLLVFDPTHAVVLDSLDAYITRLAGNE